MTSTERVIDAVPFTVRRRARFGDCDPAGVVYTVRFSDYVVSAMDLFLSDLVGGPYLARLGAVTMPMKALSFVFRAPLRPDDEFDMAVFVGEIRTRTFDLVIAAALPSGSRVFDATLTPIAITTGPERRSVPIPDVLRTPLTTYQQRTVAYAASLSD